MSLDDFDLQKARELREKAKKPFRAQLRKEFVQTALTTVPLMVLISYASVRWAQAWIGAEPIASPLYALLYLFGILFVFLLWGAYAVHTRLLSLLNEGKQLRLDLLNSQHGPTEPPTGDAESVYAVGPTAAVRPKVLVMAMTAVFVLVPLATALVVLLIESHRNVNWAEYETFGAQEVLTVHIAADGRARAVSRVSITKCPPFVATIPIRVSQPAATLESVTIGGRDIGFEPVPGEENIYEIMPGLPENALKNKLLEAVWSWPIEENNVIIHLQGLLPIINYTVNVVMDEGTPYRLEQEDKGAKNVYLMRRADGRYDARCLGYCRIDLIMTDQ